MDYDKPSRVHGPCFSPKVWIKIILPTAGTFPYWMETHPQIAAHPGRRLTVHDRVVPVSINTMLYYYTILVTICRRCKMKCEIPPVATSIILRNKYKPPNKYSSPKKIKPPQLLLLPTTHYGYFVLRKLQPLTQPKPVTECGCHATPRHTMPPFAFFVLPLLQTPL